LVQLKDNENCKKKRADILSAVICKEQIICLNCAASSKVIIYFDESGFEKHSYRPHGWALRGQKVYGDVSGNNRKDVNLIMAQRRDQWLAPVVFKGTCNTELVNTWIKDFLLKELHHPSVIVMDNARFHKKFFMYFKYD
jgi:hypothetical protein